MTNSKIFVDFYEKRACRSTALAFLNEESRRMSNWEFVLFFSEPSDRFALTILFSCFLFVFFFHFHTLYSIFGNDNSKTIVSLEPLPERQRWPTQVNFL